MRVCIFSFLLVALDQLTKWLAHAYLRPAQSREIIPGLFSLTYVENIGAAWGMMAGRQTALIAFTVLTLAWLVWKRHKLFASFRLATLIQTLLFAGIIGNLIDRLFFGRVIDFLDFYIRRSHFPAFNVADSCICCGVILFLIEQYIHDRRAKSGAAA